MIRTCNSMKPLRACTAWIQSICWRGRRSWRARSRLRVRVQEQGEWTKNWNKNQNSNLKDPNKQWRGSCVYPRLWMTLVIIRVLACCKTSWKGMIDDPFFDVPSRQRIQIWTNLCRIAWICAPWDRRNSGRGVTRQNDKPSGFWTRSNPGFTKWK